MRENFLDLQKFCIQKEGAITFLIKKASLKFLVNKKFWVQNNVWFTIFVSKIFVSKYFLFKRIVGKKKFGVHKQFGPENFLGLNKFCVQ